MVNNRKNGSIPLLSRQSGHLRNKQRRESSIYFCGENKNKPYSDYNNTQINEGVPHTMNFETCCSCSKPPNSVVCWRGWMCLFVCTKCFLELAYLWSLVNRLFSIQQCHWRTCFSFESASIELRSGRKCFDIEWNEQSIVHIKKILIGLLALILNQYNWSP